MTFVAIGPLRVKQAFSSGEIIAEKAKVLSEYGLHWYFTDH